jgi:hypothetical protein
MGPWSNEVLKMADGDSYIPGANHIREGVVIRAHPERQDSEIGRVQLKAISDVYMEKSK